MLLLNSNPPPPPPPTFIPSSLRLPNLSILLVSFFVSFFGLIFRNRGRFPSIENSSLMVDKLISLSKNLLSFF